MAGIPLLSGFNITSDSPADTRLVLTKAEMKAMKDTSMPQTYFCTDSESGEIYVYNKSNEIDETTGKFRKFESGAANAVTTDTEQTITGTKHFSKIRGAGEENENIEVAALGEEGCSIKLSGRTGGVNLNGYDVAINSTTRPTWDGKGVATEDELIKTVDGNSPDANGNVTSAFGVYTNDLGTENTTDTWMPVLNNGKIQHRVIPTNLATKDYCMPKYAETTMVSLGFTSGATVDVTDFLDKIRTTYGEQYIIKFTWTDADGAYITDGTTTTELISGYTLVSGLNCFNKTSGIWRAGGALLIGSSSRREIYNLTATVSDTEGTVSSKYVTKITGGGGGVSIDDTTPSTDKVYSSSKVNDSFLKTSGGTVKGQIWAYEYGNDRSKPAVIIDKPGQYYVGIGADGTGNRIKFGPINGNLGANDGAWLDTGTFNSNEFYFQGSLTTTASISSPYDHNFTSHGNEFNFVPSSFNGEVWFNYRTAGGANGSITAYKLGNGAGAALGTVIHSGNIYVSGGILYINV